MQLSYWERQSWFSNVDFTVVGSGIVGLHAALRLRERYPSAKILVLEKGALPEGASTKNAGFACFGSASEILDDLTSHSEDEVVALIEKRYRGLQLLRKSLGDETIDFRPHGGYELFLADDTIGYELCMSRLNFLNEILRPLFRNEVFSREVDRFGFAQTREYLIFNPYEAQIDTGKMMRALLQLVHRNDILILNGQAVTAFSDAVDHVNIQLGDLEFKSRKLLFATNGFAGAITQDAVKPARAQVLITHPIPNLDLKGTFHLDRGFYYFRNVGDRVLLGGGRNLDFEGETTTQFGCTDAIQERLETLLREVILPGRDFTIAERWSGIMGMGASKKPIVEALSNNVFCGVRLGGMGVAIGSLVGTELADLIP